MLVGFGLLLHHQCKTLTLSAIVDLCLEVSTVGQSPRELLASYSWSAKTLGWLLRMLVVPLLIGAAIAYMMGQESLWVSLERKLYALATQRNYTPEQRGAFIALKMDEFEELLRPKK